jgi:hypothetical protein
MSVARSEAQCHARDSGWPLTSAPPSATASRMSSQAQTSAGTLLRQPSIIFFLLSRSLSRFSSQIGAVAIGWQVSTI